MGGLARLGVTYSGAALGDERKGGWKMVMKALVLKRQIPILAALTGDTLQHTVAAFMGTQLFMGTPLAQPPGEFHLHPNSTH